MGYYAYGMFKTVKKKPTDFFETLKKTLSQLEDYHTYTTSNSTSILSDTL